MKAEDLKTIKLRVAYILEQVPDACYDDNLLLIMYWKLFDDIQSVDNIPTATKAETIMRNRRMLCNTHGLDILNHTEEE